MGDEQPDELAILVVEPEEALFQVRLRPAGSHEDFAQSFPPPPSSVSCPVDAGPGTEDGALLDARRRWVRASKQQRALDVLAL